MAGQRLEPRLLERLLDDIDQRPDEAGRLPWVPLGGDAAGQRQRPGDQAAGEGESHVGADAVSQAGRLPRWAESRCVSQRSIPRVGTATTSAANGSSGWAGGSPS